jgi:endonuclease/exonuclease/phosphatase family metal-dependent hydrolase
LREQEARLLREKIDARLASDSEANLVVLGDFNDTGTRLDSRGDRPRTHQIN